MELPLGDDGGLDLKPAMRAWGMENCYVSVSSPGSYTLRSLPSQVLDGCRRKPHLQRYPSEKLSPLAVNILLDGHRVIGVVGTSLRST